jgi:hypothetical protein
MSDSRFSRRLFLEGAVAGGALASLGSRAYAAFLRVAP